MTTRWILVADSSRARLFESLPPRRKDPSLLREFDHPEGREQGRDLIGNRPSLIQHSEEKVAWGHRQDALKDEEARKFARELALFLDRSHSQNAFRELVLVAPPHFLGVLRSKLSKQVEHAVVHTVDKHLVDSEARDLGELGWGTL